MSNKTFQQPKAHNLQLLPTKIPYYFFLEIQPFSYTTDVATKASAPSQNALRLPRLKKKYIFKLLKFPFNKFPSLLSFSFQRNIQNHNLHNSANVM